jgi:hypothetical protein
VDPVSGHTAEKDAWSYAPHEGPHEFRPWTVLPDHNGKPWLAPGCTCGVIRSAGKPTETEEAMRLWWDAHALKAGHTVAHEFEAFDGATCRACTKMVERDGYGEDCGLPPEAHVTRPLPPGGGRA